MALAPGPNPQAQQTQRPGPQQPARDTPAQKPDGDARHRPDCRPRSGRRYRPAGQARARFRFGARNSPGGRGVLTDDTGLFQLVELPAGRYTLSVSKSGFVSLSYGQRRPLQAGTPLQLADGQEIKDIEFRLPRGSVIAGHVYDETGDPMPGVMVRVLRYQYQQGDRRLVPAGTAQTDDQGQYRVWGLMPGDYYVDAQSRINLPFGGPAGRRRRRAGRWRGRGDRRAGRRGRGQQRRARSSQPDDENQKAYAPTYFPGVTSITEAQPITLGLSQTAARHRFRPAARARRARQRPRDQSRRHADLERQRRHWWSRAPPAGRGGSFGINYGSRIQWDGTFEISNVPPGRYTLQARGNDDDTPQFASQPLTVGERRHRRQP